MGRAVTSLAHAQQKKPRQGLVPLGSDLGGGLSGTSGSVAHRADFLGWGNWNRMRRDGGTEGSFLPKETRGR